MKDSLASLKKWFSSNYKQNLKDYATLLKFKTISTDPKYFKEIDLCAKWLKKNLQKKGLDAEIIKTPTNPIVYASTKHKKGAQTVLLYNHMDVQPVTPLKEWKHDPFIPKFDKNKKVFARGASDNKGQLFYTMLAIFYLQKLDLPVNIKYCIEAEEENTSYGLSKVLPSLKQKLSADYLMVMDSGFQRKNEPVISLGARGLITMTIEFIGSKIDLHSGSHGGIVYNPLRAAVEILSKMVDQDSKILIDHFYDDVEKTDDEKRKIFDTSFNEATYKKLFGVNFFSRNKEGSLLEANWQRPTIEINGIGGGFFEEGFKTVIPAKVIVKISCRLVPNQDPPKIAKLVTDFIKKEAAGKVEVRVKLHEAGSPFRGKLDSTIVKAASKGYEEVFKKTCKKILIGGSVSIVAQIVKTLNCDAVMMGVALPEDNCHAPNESFDMQRMEQGFLTVVKTIQNVALKKNKK